MFGASETTYPVFEGRTKTGLSGQETTTHMCSSLKNTVLLAILKINYDKGITVLEDHVLHVFLYVLLGICFEVFVWQVVCKSANFDLFLLSHINTLLIFNRNILLRRMGSLPDL